MCNVHYLDTSAKLHKATIRIIMSVCPSVWPRGTTWLPLDRFSWNLIFFLEWDLFRGGGEIVGKIKTDILCLVTCFWKSSHLWDNVEIYGSVGQVTYGNIIQHIGFACWINKAIDTHLEYIILIAYPRQQWLHECASTLLYIYIACKCRRHKTSCKYDLQTSLLGCYVMLMLKMEALCFSKMLVIIYQPMQHNIPEDLKPHQHQCETLRPFKLISASQELYETEHKWGWIYTQLLHSKIFRCKSSLPKSVSSNERS
jgi:hypothetical protein